MSKKPDSSNPKNVSGTGSVNSIKKLIRQDMNRLDKEMEEYISDVNLYAGFIQRMENWYASTQVQLIYNTIFESIEENVTYENFIACLIDLNAPCNELERHVLARLLDPNKTGKILYSNIELLLWQGNVKEELGKERFSKSYLSIRASSKTDLKTKFLDITEGKRETVLPTCGLTEIGWLHLHIKMIKFDRFSEHPGNFEIEFPDNVNLGVLALHIKKILNFPTTNFQLYGNPSGLAEHKIDFNLSFRELGFKGSSKLSPQEIIIYYDYQIGYIDDSLIMDLQF